jgi:hypothetical protein
VKRARREHEGMLGSPLLEAEPHGHDILPDQIYGPPEDEERELTVRPSEPAEPLPSDEMPQG